MRKIFCLLTAVFLLSSVASVGAEEKTKAEQPRIFDPVIDLNLAERTLEISFHYEEVAGNIDDAKMMIVIGAISAEGEINLSRIPLKVADPRGKRDDGITPDVRTQGRVKYYAVIPSTMDVGDPEEIVAASILVIDCLGRQASPVFILKQTEENEKVEKIGI